ncbi:MAG: PH domain-containing protein [Alphaproteobacteria bacterium]|nr:MAG: PH domain-containing protein [Alphaproteobacteria bacterium]
MARTYAGSRVLYSSHPRMFREAPLRFLMYLLLVPVLGYGLYLLGRWWIQSYSTRMQITETVVIFIQGILNVRRTEVRMSDIRTVHIEQTFWERLFNVGSVMISSAGSDGYEIDIRAMPNPGKIRRLIDRYRATHVGTSD